MMKSRLALVAAILAFLASVAIVLQYLGTFSTKTTLRSVGLQFRHFDAVRGDPKKSFVFAFENMGPDDLRNVSWYASISGLKLNIPPFGTKGVPLVARGGQYVARNVTSPDIMRLEFDDISKSESVTVCLSFSGGFLGAVQWITLSGKFGDDYGSSVAGFQGARLKVIETGSTVWPWSPRCLPSAA